MSSSEQKEYISPDPLFQAMIADQDQKPICQPMEADRDQKIRLDQMGVDTINPVDRSQQVVDATRLRLNERGFFGGNRGNQSGGKVNKDEDSRAIAVQRSGRNSPYKKVKKPVKAGDKK